MPELPDVALYVEALTAHVAGHQLRRVSLLSPFVLRTVDPPLDSLHGQIVRRVSRLGKRIVFEFDLDRFLVVHLMIAGRLRWRPDVASARPLALPATKIVLAIFEFDHGRLFFTEAGSTKRASLQLVRGRAALKALDPGGIEPLDATVDELRVTLSRENHTLKRALSDPHLVSGIGNAYSDEILHAARLSPLKLTRTLTAEEWTRLHGAVQATLTAWLGRLRADAGGSFPEKVTAFRDGMAVHGRFKEPCPVCGAPVQRIVYADNECNYCAICQTGGRLLADRALSRLLKDAWPRQLEAWD
jgi:formamidopyrimidine-DNA glycosylase